MKKFLFALALAVLPVVAVFAEGEVTTPALFLSAAGTTFSGMVAYVWGAGAVGLGILGAIYAVRLIVRAAKMVK
jgi:hypothetical protein